nr:hypothetical protein [Tanacetum cinerariifolium]
GRKDNVSAAATKEVNVVEPTVFDDEEVTMTMAQTLIKIKDEKERLLDEQMAKRKNMIIYLKNIVGYKMEHFKGMTYDKESFKRLKAVEVSGSHSTEDTPTHDLKVEALQLKIKEAYQSFEDMLKGFDREDLDALWRLVKEKFSSVVPTVDKEKALWVELKRLFEPDADDVMWKLQRYMHYQIAWRLPSNCGVHQVSSTIRRHDMYMLTKKDNPLSNGVMTLILSTRLEVEEDIEKARDLVMKIFMKANQPPTKSLDISSK